MRDRHKNQKEEHMRKMQSLEEKFLKPSKGRGE